MRNLATIALRLTFPILTLAALMGCGERSASITPEHATSTATTVQASGMRIKILNPGAKHLDAIVTRDTFNHLFPHTVWYQEGDVVGMYNRENKMTYLVVSEHTFDTWNDEVSSLAERLCHEKAHRADDLYQGDQWSELRDTSAPGLALDTHHFGHEKEDTTSEHKGIDLSTVASAPTTLAMVTPSTQR